MSELNVYHHELRPDEYDEFYLKYEADKVIADLEESHKMEVEQLLIEIAELNESAQNLILDNYLKDKKLRHSNYKRCLAMARWCASEENRLEAISPIFDTDKEYWEYNSDYWGKWHNRWLEIAEKFKEGV